MKRARLMRGSLGHLYDRIAMRRLRTLKGIARVLVSFLLLGFLGFCVVAQTFGPSEQITDTSRYAEIRASFGESVLVQHFPDEIPADAENVELAYLPRFLQGGSYLQLRLKLPPRRIEDLYSHFSASAIHEYRGGDLSYHGKLPDGVPTTRFYTSDTDDEVFPPTYEIFVLGAQPGGSSEFEWNHGYSYGVAIDRFASEIVYWSEYW